MKSVAGTLKIDLAQFRELEAFSTFGSELDAVSRAQLDRGQRLVELLKQPLNSPMPVEEQVVSIYAGTSGALDDIPADEVGRFERDLLDWFRSRHAGLLAVIRDTGALPDGDELEVAVKDYKQQFLATLERDEALDPNADPAATDAEAVGEAESHKTLQTE
jgi:F-type H+-transporting ATPase subunit alpha